MTGQLAHEGACPVCKLRWKVYADGRLTRHGPRPTWCPGWGAPAVPGTVSAVPA